MSDTDRELLELAAKAAGLPHRWCESWQCMAIPHDNGGFVFDSAWNPLQDDGDRYRLARKLCIKIDFFSNIATVLAAGRFDIGASWREGDDEEEARAIVGLAAEIGRRAR